MIGKLRVRFLTWLIYEIAKRTDNVGRNAMIETLDRVNETEMDAYCRQKRTELRNRLSKLTYS